MKIDDKKQVPIAKCWNLKGENKLFSNKKVGDKRD